MYFEIYLNFSTNWVSFHKLNKIQPENRGEAAQSTFEGNGDLIC